MADLHKLVISSPDGIGHGTTLTLDGQPLQGVLSVMVRAAAADVVSAVIEFSAISVEFDGLADVVGKIVRDDEGAEIAR